MTHARPKIGLIIFTYTILSFQTKNREHRVYHLQIRTGQIQHILKMHSSKGDVRIQNLRSNQGEIELELNFI